MIRIETDSGPVDMRYDEDIKMIEIFNDGHQILMRPHQAQKVMENLQRLVHFHDELGFEQSGAKDHIAYCNADGKSFQGPYAVLVIQPNWSEFRMHNEAVAFAFQNKAKAGDLYTHYRLMRRNTDSDKLYPTGVSAS